MSVLRRFECVENAITKTLPHISRARAYDIALHAHTTSKATIMLTWKEKAGEVALGALELAAILETVRCAEYMLVKAHCREFVLPRAVL